MDVFSIGAGIAFAGIGIGALFIFSAMALAIFRGDFKDTDKD